MKLLTLTSLFPSSTQPRHGVFVRERLQDLRARHNVEIRVLSPVPFWPRFLPSAKYGAFASTPRHEVFEGFDIEHPRYLMIPSIGVPMQGVLYEKGVRGTARRMHLENGFDAIDAHYAYPDGFAAALLKQRLGLPLVLTVRGTDVNLLPKQASLASQIRFALRTADRVVAVAQSLRDLAIEAGADPAKTVVLRNGVDSTKFRPLDASECRLALDLPAGRKIVVVVGFLVPRKGHALIIDALATIDPDRRPFLVIAGDGPEESALRERVASSGVAADVRFLGGVAHAELSRVYSAADVSLLASDREGWPNVLLESMACGTPVVATAVHGVPEVITAPFLGRLVTERTPKAFAAAFVDALATDFDRGRIRAHAETMDWKETSDGLAAIFGDVGRR